MSKVIHNEAFARLAQTELLRLGLYQGDLDGWAGPQTQQAFQRLLAGDKREDSSVVKDVSVQLYAHALKDNGLREIAGKTSQARIQKAILTAASWLNPDDSVTAWCGCIMGLWCKELGLPVPSEYFRALNWLDIGVAVPLSEARVGDIVVISRSGGNHVALFKDSALTLYGGNQGNAVNHAKFSPSLLRGIRRL